MSSTLKIAGASFIAIAAGALAGISLQQKTSKDSAIVAVAPPMQARAQAKVQARRQYDKTVQELESQNPILNPDSALYDGRITAEVLRRRNSHMEQGLDDSAALRQAVQEFRTFQAAAEREARDAPAIAAQQRLARSEARDMEERIRADELEQAQARQRQENLAQAAQQQAHATAPSLPANAPAQVGQNRQAAQFDIPLNLHPNGIVIPQTGEYLVPAGPNFVSSRNGTLYVPAGPNGIVNTRTGRFAPVP